MGPPSMSMRLICGSKMPSGSEPLMLAIASRTSFTARSTGVPIVNCTKVCELPSSMRVDIESTPFTPRNAASTFCETWVSISVGAAPGCTITTWAAGKLTSGLLFTCMRMKLTTPARVSATNKTIGTTGLRIAQEEMLRKLMSAPKIKVCYFDNTACTNAASIFNLIAMI